MTSATHEIAITYEEVSITCSQVALNDEVAMELVQVPSGEFLMGSPDNERDREASESPQHWVKVPGFWMGQYPVTQAEWRVVAGFPEVARELKPEPSEFTGDQHPVEYVSWYDAEEFCKRLSIHTGRQYRLPTEAEWEYACRAGTKTPFHFGQTISTDIANYQGSEVYGEGVMGIDRGTTTAVGSFNAFNTWGLSDMHGNVYEWCLDHWHEDYEGAPTDGSAWLTGNDQASRVLRGGSWGSSPRWCRSASRFDCDPDYDYVIIGFRVVSALRGTP